MAEQAQVKGVAFRTVEACFAELRGNAAVDAARALMPTELHNALRYGTLLPASWYPIAWYRETFRALRSQAGAGVDLPRAIGKAAARRDMKGVHKQILAKLVTPQILLGMSGRVFSTYYDTGSFDVLKSERGHVIARCHGCTGWDENMWSELAGSCESLLEIAGAKTVRLRFTKGGGDRDNESELEAHWS